MICSAVKSWGDVVSFQLSHRPRRNPMLNPTIHDLQTHVRFERVGQWLGILLAVNVVFVNNFCRSNRSKPMYFPPNGIQNHLTVFLPNILNTVISFRSFSSSSKTGHTGTSSGWIFHSGMLVSKPTSYQTRSQISNHWCLQKELWKLTYHRTFLGFSELELGSKDE